MSAVFGTSREHSPLLSNLQDLETGERGRERERQGEAGRGRERQGEAGKGRERGRDTSLPESTSQFTASALNKLSSSSSPLAERERDEMHSCLMRPNSV